MQPLRLRLIITFVIALSHATAVAQDLEWIQSPINNHWYAITERMDWRDALSMAESMGATLATIRSAEENQWLNDTFPTLKFVGFTDRNVEGRWEWTSGEPVTYTNWRAGEPNNVNSGEDACEVSSSDGRWNDASFANPRQAIIERSTLSEPVPVTFGTSWDGISLQEILDAEYGVGAIDVETDFEGARAGDALIPYWLDDNVDGWVVREVADFAPANVLGWYAEELSGPPVIDGVDDGVIFDGSGGEGETAFVGLPGPTRFGLYLNPNGSGDGTNAPEPEIFFTHRAYNDEGPDGTGAIHPPEGGDPQVLIFDITNLRGGVSTYVLAWEDIDSGSPLSPTYRVGYTDNDYNDLVVEIRASSPVEAEASSFGAMKGRFGQ